MSMIENFPFPATLTDLNGNCLESNRLWQEIAQMSAEESLGRGWINAFHSDDAADFVETLKGNFYRSIGGRPRRLAHRNNQELKVYVSETPITNDHGTITGILYILQNISYSAIKVDPTPNEARRITYFMADFHNAIQSLFDYCIESTDTFAMLNKALDLLLSNPWVPNLGYGAVFLYDFKDDILRLSSFKSPDGLSDRFCRTVKRGYCLCGESLDTMKTLFCHASACFLSENGEDNNRYVFPVMFGKEILGVVNILLSSDFHRTTEDDIIFKLFSLIFGGIIKLKREEDVRKKTELANKEKSGFLANMSHEMRTPMNAIIGLSDLATAHCQDTKTKDYLRKISNSSQSLLMLINDILDLSKIEAGLMELHSDEFILRDVFDQLSDVFMEKEKKGVELFFFMSYEWEFCLEGDEQKLKQVLVNLIGNAIKFTNTGKVEVFVNTLNKEENVVILQFAVRDSGIGISKETFKILFQPYTQVDNSVTRKYGGSGLGLVICKRLTERMNGRIWAESTVGEGSIFYFSLPFFYHSIDNIYNETVSSEKMSGLKILLVTADPTTESTLVQAINTFTFSAVSTNSCEEALDLMRSHEKDGNPFDLVIFDWNPSMMKGSTDNFLSRCECLQPPKLVILVTNNNEYEVFSAKHAFNADAIISKPINYSYLFDSIMSIFGRNISKINKNTSKVDYAEIIEKIGGAHVLLVEDHDINLQVAKEILENALLKVHTCSNGQEAVQKVDDYKYDAVIMDVHMPIMDGLTASRLIRKKYDKKTLPIIALSAAAMTLDKEKCLKAGMNGYISKPINKVDLFGSLVKHITKRDGIGIILPKDHPLLAGDKIPPSLFTHIPGFDMVQCRSLYQGRQDLFISLLKQFKTKYANYGEKIRNAILMGDMVSARKLAHAIAGVSGSLAARDLYESALAIETAILETNPNILPRLSGKLELLLQEVIASITVFLSNKFSTIEAFGAENNQDQKDQSDQSTQISLISSLGESISKYEYSARKYLKELRLKIKNEDAQKMLENIQNHLDSVDYKKADVSFKLFVDTFVE